MSKVIVQYIVVRRDLNWPLGALMAQACHASTAATHLHYQHPGNSSEFSLRLVLADKNGVG